MTARFLLVSAAVLLLLAAVGFLLANLGGGHGLNELFSG